MKNDEDMGTDPIKFTAKRGDSVKLTCKDQSFADYNDQDSPLIKSEALITVYCKRY